MTNLTESTKNLNGFHYFALGWRLITRPGLKRFVILPLLANIIILGSAFWWLYGQIGEMVNWVMEKVPDWLQWLSYVIWPLSVIFILLVFTYFFSTIANIIASPFNGLLAEKLEGQITGINPPDTGLLGITKDIPRILKREIIKVVYYLPRAIVLLLLYFVPVVGQTVAPILWFIFGAWMMAIQYNDFPFDNHKVSFANMKSTLKKDKWNNLQFGMVINIFTMIPILNLVIMPVAICGATAMWCDRYRHQHVQAGQW